MLANRIQKYIKRIILYDQVWFIPFMQSWFNILNQSINTMHFINRLKKKDIIISIDTKNSILQNSNDIHDF